MPKLRLERSEIHRFETPTVCAVCGQPSDLVLLKTFRWSPEWIMVFIVIGALCFHAFLLVGIILSFALAKKMIVPMPLCRRHKNYWRKRVFWTYVPVTTTLLMAAVEIGLLFGLSKQPQYVDLVGYSCGGTALLFFIALFVAAIVQRGTIGADQMTDSDVVIGRLSKEYVSAMRDMDDDFDRPIRRRPEPLDDDRRESFRADREDRPRDTRETFRAEPGDE